jgi:hypothetical protein
MMEAALLVCSLWLPFLSCVSAVTMQELQPYISGTVLKAWNVGLTGSITPEVGDLTYLTEIDLLGNELTGPIPPQLGNLVQLQVLNLMGNSLTGAIPPFLCSSEGVLAWLKLDHNDLSGPIPSFEVCKNLTNIGLSENKLSGPIPPELFPRKCPISRFGSRGREVSLDRNFQVTGSVPESVLDCRYNWLAAKSTSVWVSNSMKETLCTSTPPTAMIDLSHVSYGDQFHSIHCHNKESTWVTLTIFGVFAVIWFLTFCVLRYRQESQYSSNGMAPNDSDSASFASGTISRCYKRLRELSVFNWASYIWGIIGPVLLFADLATDLLVLDDLLRGGHSRSWAVWVLLAFALLPYIISGVAVWWAWVTRSGWTSALCQLLTCKGTIRWAPNAKVFGPSGQLGVPSLSMGTWRLVGYALLILQMAMALVVVADLFAVLGRLGLQVHVEQVTWTSDGYIRGRNILEVVFRTIPQIVLQTVFYNLGSRFATGVYITVAIYVPSIILSLCALLCLILNFQWQSMDKDKDIIELAIQDIKMIFLDVHVENEATSNVFEADKDKEEA